MLTEAGRTSWNGTEWQMNVTDEGQKTVLGLSLHSCRARLAHQIPLLMNFIRKRLQESR
jgi:hypothetical protein